MTQEQLEFWRKMGREICPKCNNLSESLWKHYVGCNTPADIKIVSRYNNRKTDEWICETDPNYIKPDLSIYYCEECNHEFKEPTQ